MADTAGPKSLTAEELADAISRLLFRKMLAEQHCDDEIAQLCSLAISELEDRTVSAAWEVE